MEESLRSSGYLNYFHHDDGERKATIRNNDGLFLGMLSFEILTQQNEHCLHSIYLFNCHKLNVGIVRTASQGARATLFYS